MKRQQQTRRSVAVLAALFLTLPGPAASRAFALGANASAKGAKPALTPVVSSLRAVPSLALPARLDAGIQPVSIPETFPLPQTPSVVFAMRFSNASTPEAENAGAAAAEGLANLAVPAAEAEASGFGEGSAKAIQDETYDGGSSVAAPLAEAVAAGDYMSRPPSLPLARLRPNWQPVVAPSAPDLGYRLDGKGLAELGLVRDMATVENLSLVPDSGLVRDLTPDVTALSYGQRRFLGLPGGVKQAAMAADILTWVDDQGRLILYSPSSGKKASVTAAAGPIERYAMADDGRHAFVWAAGTLQRWDLVEKKAEILTGEKFKALGLTVTGFVPARPEGKDSGDMRIVTDKGSLFWIADSGKLFFFESGSEEVTAGGRVPPPLKALADGYWAEDVEGGSRLWARVGQSGGPYSVADLGRVPHKVLALTEAQDGKLLLAVTETGFLQWDLAQKKYRHFEVEGLKEAVVARKTAVDSSKDGNRVLIQAGDRLFYVDLGQTTRAAESYEASVRLWSEENPMYVKDGVLHIGEFAFALQQRKAAALPWYRAFWNWLTSLVKAGASDKAPALTYEEWQAVNLPSNKWAIYQTLKGFTLGHNVLYVGETGGGKTWMADILSRLIGRKLYMVSFTEYTKNQDLIARTTFGEEGANRTGITYGPVLKWLDDPEGGILLLDEIHKPLEGIAALNNILQNLKYHINGKDVMGSRKTHFIVATMNPAKQPYKGEPPSGELASRFGLTLEINYLPPAEEAALLSIFHRGFPAAVAKILVDVATALRRAYVEGTLPLPISSRTLLNAAKHMLGFPNDDPESIFRATYNAEVVAPDESIKEALTKVLQAHGLAKAWAEARRPKKA